MKSLERVIGAVGNYQGSRLPKNGGTRVQVFEVHRYGLPEAEIGPCMVAGAIAATEDALRRIGGLHARDHLLVGFLNPIDELFETAKYLVPAGEVELDLNEDEPAQFPGDWAQTMDQIVAAERKAALDKLAAISQELRGYEELNDPEPDH